MYANTLSPPVLSSTALVGGHRSPLGPALRKVGGMVSLLWLVLVVLLALWLLGLVASVGGSLINILLVIALVVLIVNLVSGSRSGRWY